MQKSKITNKTLLRERIERNYKDFKKATLQLDDESIFEYAPTIKAVQDVYSFIVHYNELNEEETEFFLQYENPLRLLADAWEYDCRAFFDDIIDEIMDDDNRVYNMTVTTADELREKYGDDIPLEAAIICELVEIGKKLFNI